MAWPLGLPLLLSLLSPFWAPTRADGTQFPISLFDDIGQQVPEPRSYEWSISTGFQPPSTVPQVAQLLLQPSEEVINTTFICCISNALGMAQAVMSALLLGAFRKRSLLLLLTPALILPGVLIYFLHFRQSGQDRHSVSENATSILCPQVRTTKEPCRNEMETETRTTVMRTEGGTGAGTKVEIKPENEEEIWVEIMKQWWKQRDRFNQNEDETKWGTKEMAEVKDDSGISEQQSWGDDGWDSGPPSNNDPDELLPAQRLARDDDSDSEGGTVGSDEDEIRWRERQRMR